MEVKLEIFEAIPKNWGNSVGITIPKEIIKKENISSKKKVKFIIIGDERNELKKNFGSVKLKKDTQKAMDEIDEEGYE